MNNDLISRSALKERAKTMLKIIGEDNLSDYEQGKKYAFETAIDFINNAPTVNKFYDYNEGYKDGFSLGFKRGSESNERPHLIDNCDMNVFEPEKYMEGGADMRGKEE